MPTTGLFRHLLTLCTLGALCATPVWAEQPKNPALGDGLCTLTHCDGYQTGALPAPSPQSPSRRLGEKDIDLLWQSPISAGAFDRRYPDGKEAFWVLKVDRIAKVALVNDQLTTLQELRLPPGKYPYYSAEDMQRFVAELDRHAPSSAEFKQLAAHWRGYEFEGLRAFYGALGRDGTLYSGMLDRIVAYTDADPARADSPIVRKGEFVFDRAQMNRAAAMPVPIIIGFNALHDGHLAAVSMDGTLVVIAPDLSSAQYYRLGPDETIWNSLSIDEKGGVYFVSNKKLYKRVWKNGHLSDRAEDGAWTEAYDIGPKDAQLRGARGSGSTPVLMGNPEDRDRFVIIADAADVNNAVLYWRDEIPADWQTLPGATSRRVAGQLPVDFGDPKRQESYSESAAVVLGYGAVFADGRPRNGEAMRYDVALRLTDPTVTPSGLQHFRWDPQQRRFLAGWTRTDVTVPGSTPAVSSVDGGLNFVGVVDGHWAWQVLDFATGQTRAVYDMGPSQRHNGSYIVMQLLPNGDPLYASFAGMVRLRVGQRPQP